MTGLIGAMLLTTPAMLFGVALAALPIIAHLMNRRARRQLTFPSLRLLHEATATQSRLYRLRRWLLLALRCALIALLAWAFARPVWTEGGAGAALPGQGVAVVIVMDISASSGQRHDGVTVLHRMKEAAGRIIDELLPDSDAATVVLADANPSAMWPRLSANLSGMRQQIAQVTPSHERANLAEAMALGGQLLGDFAGQKRLIVLSDMQATNWSEVRLAEQAGRWVPKGTRLTVSPIEQPAGPNAGLSKPVAFPARPIVQRPVQLLVTVSNHADYARAIDVAATIDGQPLETQSVSLEAHESREAAFTFTPTREGDYRVVFAVEPDALVADDHAYLAVRAVRQAPVVIVSDDDLNDEATTSYYLSRILSPLGDVNDDLKVTQIRAAELTAGRLAGVEAVFVGYLAGLDVARAKVLVEYVRGGGGMAILCDDGAVTSHLLALAEAAGRDEVLPWLATTRRDFSANDAQSLHITDGAWSSSMLSGFDRTVQEALRNVAFMKVWSTEALRPGASTLLSFSDGTAALSAQYLGEGRVLAASFTLRPDAGDLVRYPVVVGLVHGMADFLRTPDRRGEGATAGQPVLWSGRLPAAMAQGATFSVIGPDDRTVACDVTLDGDTVRVLIPRATLPGFYRVMRTGEAAGLLAVNVDGREGDLRRINLRQLQDGADATASGAGTEAAPIDIQPADDNAATVRLRGEPLWHLFLIAAIVVVAVELLLVGVWRR